MSLTDRFTRLVSVVMGVSAVLLVLSGGNLLFAA